MSREGLVSPGPTEPVADVAVAVAPEGATVRTVRGRPRLSVVIASVNGLAHLDACLAALARQRGGAGIEVVVVGCRDEGARELVAREYPAARLLPCAEPPSVPRLRAIGIEHSRGDLVAIIGDQCIPSADWVERIVEAHRAPYAAIGGAVELGATDRLVDWAVFLCEYSRYMNPVPRGVTDDIPGNNVAYKRAALAHLGDVLVAGRWEYFLHRRLREVGLELYSDPSIVVYHRKSFTVREFLAQRFHYGRSFAGMRVEGAPVWRRALFALGSPVLPPLLIGRIGAGLFARRRHRLVFSRAFPLLSLFTLSWMVGEFVGYLAGPGDSLSRVE